MWRDAGKPSGTNRKILHPCLDWGGRLLPPSRRVLVLWGTSMRERSPSVGHAEAIMCPDSANKAQGAAEGFRVSASFRGSSEPTLPPHLDN